MRAAPPPLWPFGRRALLSGGLALLFGLLPRSSQAKAKTKPAKPRGKPQVTLDALVFPDDVPSAREFERHLKHALRREARRADWGVGAGAKIEYRFIVEELAITLDGNVLRVRCTALGRLPKGRSARSRLDYGGNPAHRNEEVKKVLVIVARGVMTRLADIERRRRGR